MSLTKTLTACGLMLMFCMNSAHAVMMLANLDGNVTVDNGGTNPFGLVVGDGISATVTYDDALVDVNNADQGIFIDGLSGWGFSINIGSFTFAHTDVTDPTYSELWFKNGVLDGISFFIEPIDLGGFTNLVIGDFSGGRGVYVDDFGSPNPVTYFEAEWDFTTVTTEVLNGNPEPVPAPASLVLLSSGGLLLCWSRRKRAV